MDKRRFILGSAALGGWGLGTWLLKGNHSGIADSAHAAAATAHAESSATAQKVAAEVPLLPLSALPAGKPHRPLRRLRYTAATAGMFAAELRAAAHTLNIARGRQTTAWLYNGQMPGPLIDVHEGDRIEIRFKNDLAQASTIHWHGLPVPPDQDGNPQDAVPAGGARTYRFTLPVGSAGTYWYHPHPHGDSAEQVYRGLAGPFIVRAIDDPLAAFSEQHLVISDLRLDMSAQIPDNTANDWMDGREGQFVLVNGQREPIVRISGRQRLRLWNACNARYLRLAIPGEKLILVGTDGGLIETPQELDEILLAPAQRIELLVGNGQPARRQLKALVYDRQKMAASVEETERLLATLDFTRGVVPSIPATLRKLEDFGQEVATKKVEFSEVMSMDEGRHSMGFLVNGHTFDMNRIDLTSKVGAVEIWEIHNNADMDHPFHLHGTQFVVLDSSIDGAKAIPPYRALRDTVNLRPNEVVRVKTIQRYPGLRMFHCHILEHEAQGMMGQLKIVER